MNFKKCVFFSLYKSDGFFWFRILGYGLCVKDIRKHSLTFSERYGLKKRFPILKLSITFLSPNKF